MKRSLPPGLLALLPLVLTFACINVQTRVAQEYLLSWQGEAPHTFEPGAATRPTGPTVAIGPIVLPTYLQRAGIVTRETDNRITASVAHTWGEPLEAGVAFLLVQGVVRGTGGNQVAGLPWPFPGHPDLRVAVQIINFERGPERKICAMGIRCSRWVTMHGLALNVNTDLTAFDHIVPCGITDRGVTCMARETGRELSLESVASELAAELGVRFDAELIRTPASDAARTLETILSDAPERNA